MKSKIMKSQILKNIFSNYVARVIGMLLGFLIIPFLIRKLGTEAYGLVVLAESTIAVVEIVTISVRMALSRHATYSLSQNKTDEFVEYLSTGRVLLYFSAAITLTAGFLVSFYFPDLFRVPAAFETQSKVLFFLITTGFVITVPNTVYWSVLYAKQRFDLINLCNSFGLIARAFCLFALFSFLPQRYVSLPVYGLVYLLMQAIENYFVFFMHKRLMPGLRLSAKRFKKEKVREILSFSFHTSLSRLSLALPGSIVNIIVNLFWGPAYNAIYSVSMKFPMMMRRMFSEATWSLTPTFTDLAARKDRERLEALFFMYSKAVSIVTMPLSLVLILLARPLIRLWVGEDFEMAGRLLPIMAFPLLFSIPFSVCACLNNAYAKVKWPSLMGVVSTVFSLSVGSLLALKFGMELFGFAIASCVSALLYMTFFTPFYACRIAGIPVRRYLVESLIKPLSWALVGFGAGLVLFDRLCHDQLLSPVFLAGLAALFVLHFVGAYVFLLVPKEKKHIADFSKVIVSAFKRPFAGVPEEDRV